MQASENNQCQWIIGSDSKRLPLITNLKDHEQVPNSVGQIKKEKHIMLLVHGLLHLPKRMAENI